MKKMKNNLDERQEQVLLQIEHRGCYLAFWGLLVVFLAEAFLFGFDFKTIAGEWAVFMILALYLFGACMKNGIWDRHLKPTFRTNFIISLVAALLTGALMGISVFARYPDKPAGSIAAGAITAVFVFVPCILVLSISAVCVKKKVEKQEKEPTSL